MSRTNHTLSLVIHSYMHCVQMKKRGVQFCHLTLAKLKISRKVLAQRQPEQCKTRFSKICDAYFSENNTCQKVKVTLLLHLILI